MDKNSNNSNKIKIKRSVSAAVEVLGNKHSHEPEDDEGQGRPGSTMTMNLVKNQSNLCLLKRTKINKKRPGLANFKKLTKGAFTQSAKWSSFL